MEFSRHLPATPLRTAVRTKTVVRRLLLARSLRDFGDGFVVLLLPVYLTALGLSPFEVGVVASAALCGSTLLNSALTFLATQYDYRQLLIGAAGLMIATGVAFSLFDDYVVLLVVAFAGTVNPSTGSFSPTVPLEHAVLAREASNAERTRTFVSYSLIGALAGALGALAASTPDFLTRVGVGQVAALKAMFVLYALLGLFGGLIYARIPARRRLPKERTVATLGPSRIDVYKLAALFCLDAFAGGLVVQSLLALWLFERFDMSLTAASLFFSWSGILSAFSLFVAPALLRRIGLVNATVLTHVSSSIFLILAAIAPTLSAALLFLLLRAALSQMDAPIRSAYLTALVAEYERPAAAAITSVSSRFAASAGPALGGALLATSFRGWPLVIAGALKIISDVLLLLEFRNVKPPEEARSVRGSVVPQTSSRSLPSGPNPLPRPSGNN